MKTIRDIVKIVLFPFIIYQISICYMRRNQRIPLIASQEDSRRQEFNDTPIGRVNWCSSDSTDPDRICNFHNLCYSHYLGKYLLFSVVKRDSGETSEENKLLLLISRRETFIHTSPITGYRVNFTYVNASRSVGDDKDLHFHRNYYQGKYLIVTPFVPGNIMHAIHDDLLPIFHTLRTFDNISDISPRTLFFYRLGVTQNTNLYQSLSENKYIQSVDFDYEPNDSLSCFEDVTVGVLKDTLWYQYGMEDVPQGPIFNSTVTSEDIKLFTHYVKKRFDVSSKCSQPRGQYGVYFRRKSTRKIINEKELTKAIHKLLNMNVIQLSFEDNTIADIVDFISCAKFVVGVHGSLFIFSMFLPPSSLIFEIFPFGIRPEAYTPYKTLASLPGMEMEYLSWRNKNRSRTVTHPERPANEGGIVHLSKEEQERIINSDEVPPHLCCYDPEFHYRINQDTVVDVPDILKIIKSSEFYINNVQHCTF